MNNETNLYVYFPYLTVIDNNTWYFQHDKDSMEPFYLEEYEDE